MKNISKVILILFGLIAMLSLGYFFVVKNGKTVPPKRLAVIPNSAIWIGGADQGFWFDMVNVDSAKRSYRFKIYDDYKGELIVDADFVKDNTCLNNYPLSKEILDKISLFDLDKIVMSDNCRLRMIRPVYGGSLEKK